MSYSLIFDENQPLIYNDNLIYCDDNDSSHSRYSILPIASIKTERDNDIVIVTYKNKVPMYQRIPVGFFIVAAYIVLCPVWWILASSDWISDTWNESWSGFSYTRVELKNKHKFESLYIKSLPKDLQIVQNIFKNIVEDIKKIPKCPKTVDDILKIYFEPIQQLNKENPKLIYFKIDQQLNTAKSKLKEIAQKPEQNKTLLEFCKDYYDLSNLFRSEAGPTWTGAFGLAMQKSIVEDPDPYWADLYSDEVWYKEIKNISRLDKN